MQTQREKIIKKAMEILENSPNGIRYTDLVRHISEALPDVKINTVHGTIWEFKQKIDQGKIKDVARPERGLYILKRFIKERVEKGLEEIAEKITSIEKTIQKEENFYQPFADYLINELEECDKAIPLGGNKLKDKWGTPDVIGVYRFSETDPIRPLPQIISAEIKTDTTNLITAFGQACAYKLFSHKVYLVIPDDAPSIDVGRLESLCLNFGIGLIIFNKSNPQTPNFRILVRAVKGEPDYFYVNEYLKRLGEDSRKLF
jgi:hypothetical protein